MSAADRLQSILSTIPSGNDIPPPAHSPPSTSATTPSPSDPRIQAILNTINTAEKAGKYLYQDINSIISPEDWTPEIATALLVGLKDRLCSEWKDQGPILKEALQNTAEKLVGVWGNVDEDNAPPFLAILFTFGVMNMVVPYEVMEALGYDNQMAGRALIEGGCADRWRKQFPTAVSKTSFLDYMHQCGLVRQYYLNRLNIPPPTTSMTMSIKDSWEFLGPPCECYAALSWDELRETLKDMDPADFLHGENCRLGVVEE